MATLPRISEVQPKIAGTNSAGQLNIGDDFIATIVDIELWSSLEEGDLVELFLDGNIVVGTQTVGRKPAPSTELTLAAFSIPKVQLPLGAHTLTYKHTAKDQIGSPTAASRFTPPATFVVINLSAFKLSLQLNLNNQHANGTATNIVIATLLDTNNKPISGQPLEFNVPITGSSQFTTGARTFSATTDANGRVTARITNNSTAVASTQVTCEISGIPATRQTITVGFVKPQPEIIAKLNHMGSNSFLGLMNFFVVYSRDGRVIPNFRVEVSFITSPANTGFYIADYQSPVITGHSATFISDQDGRVVPKWCRTGATSLDITIKRADTREIMGTFKLNNDGPIVYG